MTEIAAEASGTARVAHIWEEATPIYLLRSKGGGILLVEPVEHADLCAGDRVVVEMGSAWMLTLVASVGPRSVTTCTGERWGVNRDHDMFDRTRRVVGRLAAGGKIEPLPADAIGFLKGWTLDGLTG